MIAMPFGIGNKRSKPQVEQQTPTQVAPAPAVAPTPPTMPADWAARLKPSGPKGRFTQGENRTGYTG
jgi:hypothetical protein